MSQKCPNCGNDLPANAPAGHCPTCLLRVGLAVADGGLGFGLDDSPLATSSALHTPHSAFEKVRYIGDYELLEEIAHGGMGIVYRARQVSLNRIVALKMIRAGEFANESEVARFRAEAEAVANLDHPNIVPIYEVGEHEGRHYFSMKLVAGGSLAARFLNDEFQMTNKSDERSPQPFDIRHLSFVISLVARAVHYAHQRGILHRDLKPGNILLDDHGAPHVTDFGLAKRLDTDSMMTQSGAILGTPSYIAPEQAAGAKVLTIAADVYSLGAMLYELLTGQPPFIGATVMETLQKVMNEEPVPPSIARSSRRKEALTKNEAKDQSLLTSAATSIDRDLETICLKCLEKDPARRYGSAEALAEDLERWLAHKPIHARAATINERIVKWVQRKPALAAAAATLLLVALAGLTGIFWQWRNAETARQNAVEKLWNSYLAQARARRISGVMGQHIESLSALRAAAKIKPSFELRDEAIAVLALNDLRATPLWRPHASPMAYSDWAADSSLRHIAVRDHPRAAIRLWQSDTGGETELSYNNGRNGRELRFSPDGRWLAAHYYDGSIVLWDYHQRQPKLLANLGLLSEYEPLDFSRDSQMLAVAVPQSRIRLFNVETGSELPPLAFTNLNWTPALRFNPRKNSLAIGVGDTIQVWDYETRQLLFSNVLPRRVFTLAWHPDGRRIAFACWHDPDIQVWDMEGSSRRVLHGVTGAATHLSFHPGGDILASRSIDGATRLWNLVTDQPLVKTDSGLSMDFSEDGKRLVYDRETEGIGVWEVVSSQVYRTFRAVTALSQPLNDVSFSPDGRLIVWSGVDGLGWLDQTTGQIGTRKSRQIGSIGFHPAGQSLFSGGDDGVIRWSVRGTTNEAGGKTGFEAAATILPGDIDFDKCVRWSALSGDGSLVAMAANIWAAVLPANGGPGGVRVPSSNSFVSIGISADGRWLACGEEEGDCVISQSDTGMVTQRLEAPSASITFDPKNRWLVTGTVKEYSLWELGTWRCLRHWPRKSALKRSGVAAFTRDGAWLAVAHTPDLVRLLDPETDNVFATLTPPSRLLIRALAFSPDGSQLAVASDNGIVQVWELAKLRRELRSLGLDWPNSDLSKHAMLPAAQHSASTNTR